MPAGPESVRESAQHVQESFLASTRAVMQLHDLREVKQSEELVETLKLEAEFALACADARAHRASMRANEYTSVPTE